MARVKIRYYKIVRGRAFWKPEQKMRDAGFRNTPLGLDGPAAWAHAEELNARWDAVRRGEIEAPALTDKSKRLTPEQADDLKVYRRGSLGEAFQHYRKMDEWKIQKAERTREDWMRGWKYIEPVFGNVPPRKVTATQISKFRSNVLEGHGEDAAFRAIKYWRALWKVASLNKYCDLHLDPSQILRNHAPEGRDQSWLEAEAWALSNHAWNLGYYGLSAALGVMWDSQLSPVDVRGLTASQFATANKGQFFFTDRKKTDKPVGGMLSARSADRLADYLEKRGTVLATNDFLFVNRSGAPYSKDTFGDDFRDVRTALYGPDEKRTMADFRRSGAGEAIAGGAQPAPLAHAMGNSLDRSNKLFATYCPVNVVNLQIIAKARREGAKKLAKQNKPRAILEDKTGKSANIPAGKVPTAK
jgi:hypothetical protein